MRNIKDGKLHKIIISVKNALPSLIITASRNDICEGETINFTALASQAGNSPNYQWRVNGLNTGTNSAVYSNNRIVNGDMVSCILTPNNSACSGVAISSNIITMTLKSKPTVSITSDTDRVAAGGAVQLKGNVSGAVNTFIWAPANMLTAPNTLTPLTSPIKDATAFILNVTNTQGCTNNAQINIKVSLPFLMPSAFSPNNDGVNDLFMIPPGSDLKLRDFSVFDRWGNKIFNTKDISKAWDGKLSGINLSSGIFVYIISGILGGTEIISKGSFLLVR